MKKGITKEQAVKRLAKAKAKHDIEESKSMASAKRSGWDRTPVAFRPSMKYYTRLHMFKGSNNVFNPIEMTAYSYNWWRYLEIIKGKLVFNDYSYSQQTNNHQGSLWGVLRQLGIKVDATVHIRGGLQALFTEALPAQYANIFDNEIAISRGRDGTWAQKHRHSSIKFSKKEIKVLRSLGAKLSAKSIKTIRDEIYKREEARLKAVADQKAFLKSAVKNDSLFNLSVGA